MPERQAAQLERREKSKKMHVMRSEGYKLDHIAEHMGVSRKTVTRMLSIACICRERTRQNNRGRIERNNRKRLTEIAGEEKIWYNNCRGD